MSRAEFPRCLLFAGALGHTWFVTADDGAGGERLVLHANDGVRAAECFDELGDKARGIYQLVDRRWRRVSRAAAVLS